MINVNIVSFDKQHSPHICDIRQQVFTQEQKIDAEIDLDGLDPDCVHVLVSNKGHYVATGRMQSDGHIGRLAVLSAYRNQRIGTDIIQCLIRHAKKSHLPRVYLGAQHHVVSFYEKLGFKRYGEPFIEVGIKHILMEYVFSESHS